MMKRLLTTMLAAPLFWACSDSSPDTTGATSETTNGIALTVVDALNKPIAHARLTLYAKETLSILGNAEADTAGVAQFALRTDTLTSDIFVEGIAGGDSSLMAWTPFDTAQTKIPLLPSASLTVRTGATETDFAALFDALALDSTPYAAFRNGGEYTFAHIPAGAFNVVAGDSLVATVALDTGSTADTLLHVPNITREFVFEDFEDGDSINNLAKVYPNYGWYFYAANGARWITPDSIPNFTKAITDSPYGKILSTEFSIGDSGQVLLGTHIGLDTGYYDLSHLTAIRMKISGDCEFAVALEHYKDIGDNAFRKALWYTKASEDWREIILRPGEEILESDSYQVSFSEIATEIGIFSIFIKSGTYLQIDDIVFEGIDSIP